MGTRYSNLEIARAGLCTEGAVRNGRKDGRLEDNDPASLAMFVLQMRMKAEGWGFMSDVVGVKPGIETAKDVRILDIEEKSTDVELGYVPDNTQIEGEW